MWITLIYGFAKLDSHQTQLIYTDSHHNRRGHEKSGTHCGDEQILHVYGASRETMALNDLAFSQKSMGDDVCKRIVLLKARVNVNPVTGKLCFVLLPATNFRFCACMYGWRGKKRSFVCWSTRIWWKSSIFAENPNEIQPLWCATRAEKLARNAKKAEFCTYSP